MLIKSLVIEPSIALKLFEKHNVRVEEIHDALRDGKPKFKSAGGDQYVAIGLAKSRYITIFFRYDQKTKGAEITTAYPSDKKQIKSYKKVKP